MNQDRQTRGLLWLAFFLVLAGISLRVARHYGWIELPPNFAPVAAIAMFSAVYLPKRLAFGVPVALLIVSDALIGWYEFGVVASVYVSFGVSLWLGRWLRSRLSLGRLAGATLVGSMSFFLITNAAVWLFGHGYPPGVTGLMEAYIAGLPFFRNTVFGDAAYVTAIFGLYQVAVVYSKKRWASAAARVHG